MDFFRGKISARRLLTLIKGLRPGARIHKDWSQETHLQADQVDLLNMLVWQTYVLMSMNAGKRATVKAPEGMRRPGAEDVKKEKPKFASATEVKQWLARGPRVG